MKAIKKVSIRSHFKETAPIQNAVTNGPKFKVVLIQEGLGNLRDCFYYTKQALQGATSIFEGRKCMADHPSQIEEQSRPERSTRDILGYYENVQFEEGADGRGMLTAQLCPLSGASFEWAQALLSTSVEYAKKYPNSDFVGLSINASGEANEISIEDFMRETDVPSSVLPKLQEAQSQGIQTIRVVNQLTEAVSCDLVTEAGAGGKILQMLEQARKPMKQNEMKQKQKKENESESEAHQENEAMTQGDQADGAKPDHADEDQDKALFAKMIKQYLGDDSADDQEAHEMAQHAYQAHREQGMEHEAAYEAAGNHLKMAAHIGKSMAQKQAMKQNESESEAEAHETDAPPPHPGHSGGNSAADSDGGTPGKKQPAYEKRTYEKHYQSNASHSCSHQKKLIEALGEVARLKESLKKYELASYLDKKLKESGKNNTVTKQFREALGAPKSKEQIDVAFKLFMTGVETGAEGSDDFSSFMFTEKSVTTRSKGAGGSFEDCLS